MRRATIAVWCAAIAAGFGIYATAVQSRATMREVEIQITDHKPGIADFRHLAVGLKGISVHSKGQPRNAGWLVAIGSVPPVDIVPLKDGRFESIGTAKVPAGRYDALRIEFSKPRGELLSGDQARIVARDTTIATKIDLRNEGPTSILVDLFAENQTDHSPQRYVIKVKDVRIGR